MTSERETSSIFPRRELFRLTDIQSTHSERLLCPLVPKSGHEIWPSLKAATIRRRAALTKVHPIFPIRLLSMRAVFEKGTSPSANPTAVVLPLFHQNSWLGIVEGFPVGLGPQ